MITTTCKKAGTPKACPKKTTELFYVTHPKMPKARLRPFLTQAFAECECIVMRSADTMVTEALVNEIDEITHWQAISYSQVMRMFAGADRQDCVQ